MSREVLPCALLYLLPLFASSFYGASSCSLPDDCFQFDIKELEDYLSKLNLENAPTVNTMIGGLKCPITAVPFGALKSDWTRLLLLQRGQSEGSILKEKLGRLFRILAIAYHQVEKPVASVDCFQDETTKLEEICIIGPRSDENILKKLNDTSSTTVSFSTIENRATAHSTSRPIDTNEEERTEFFFIPMDIPNNNLDNDTSDEESRATNSISHDYTLSSAKEPTKINELDAPAFTLTERTEINIAAWYQEIESNEEFIPQKESHQVTWKSKSTTEKSLSDEVAINGDKYDLITADYYYTATFSTLESDERVTNAESSRSSPATTFSSLNLSGSTTSEDRQIFEEETGITSTDEKVTNAESSRISPATTFSSLNLSGSTTSEDRQIFEKDSGITFTDEKVEFSTASCCNYSASVVSESSVSSSRAFDAETTTEESPSDRGRSSTKGFHGNHANPRTSSVFQIYSYNTIPWGSTGIPFYRNKMKKLLIVKMPPMGNQFWNKFLTTPKIPSSTSTILESIPDQTEKTNGFAEDKSRSGKRGSFNTDVEKSFRWFYSNHRTSDHSSDVKNAQGINIECDGEK